MKANGDETRRVAHVILVEVIVVQIRRVLCLPALLLLLLHRVELVAFLSLWRQEQIVERHAIVFLDGLGHRVRLEDGVLDDLILK